MKRTVIPDYTCTDCGDTGFWERDGWAHRCNCPPYSRKPTPAPFSSVAPGNVVAGILKAAMGNVDRPGHDHRGEVCPACSTAHERSAAYEAVVRRELGVYR